MSIESLGEAQQHDLDFQPASQRGWRRRVFDVIFHHEAGAPRLFDIVLIAAILLSVLVVILDSEAELHRDYAPLFYALEWGFTIVFTIEYALRILVVKRPVRYAGSFFGIIDLLSILPTWLSLFIAGSQYLLVVRVLRILRVFRVLKLVRYVDEAGLLLLSLRRSRRKVLVFVFAILNLVVIFGALMYLIEGPENGFTSIPVSMYWAIVTMATVGFGDIAPHTALGQFVTSILILIGYGIIAVPTGIYTAELANTLREKQLDSSRCPSCNVPTPLADATYCHACGALLKEKE
ncbi:MAG: ion transporter [Rhodanobacteraceae bacterium]|nr:ion transporter [Xanthomonadales bacterium]MCP5477530.1 ion transporter [Rhodanobacteraceae bacterium]